MPGEQQYKIAKSVRQDVLKFMSQVYHSSLEGMTAEFSMVFGKKKSHDLRDFASTGTLISYSSMTDIIAFMVGKEFQFPYAEKIHPAFIELSKYAFANKVSMLDLANDIGYTQSRNLMRSFIYQRAISEDTSERILKFVRSNTTPKTDPQPEAKAAETFQAQRITEVTPVVESGLASRRIPILTPLLLAVHAMLGEFLENSTEQDRNDFRTALGTDKTFEVSNQINAACSETAFRNYRKSEKEQRTRNSK